MSKEPNGTFSIKYKANYGYPPNKQEQAVNLVMEQAAIICKDWAENE